MAIAASDEKADAPFGRQPHRADRHHRAAWAGGDAAATPSHAMPAPPQAARHRAAPP